MNDLIRLTLNVDPKSASSPLQGMTELPGIDQFTQGFVDAFVAIGADQIDEKSEGEVVFDSDHSQSLEPGIDMSVVPVENTDDAVILRAPDTDLQSRERIEPLDSTVEEIPLTRDEKPLANIGAHEGQAHVIAPLPSAQMEAPLRTNAKGQTEAGGQIKSAVNRGTPLAFGEYGRPVARPDDIMRKVKSTPFTDAATPKDKMTMLNADLVSFAGKQHDTKMGLTADGAAQSARPAIQANPLSSATPSAITFAVPTAPVPITGTAPIVLAAPITAPAIPVLDVDRGDQWVARLSQDIGQLTADKSALSFQLKPNHLGKLNVEIATGAAGDIVRMETESENAKALILGSQGRLEQDIRLSGLKLARIDVAVQDQSASQSGQQEAGARDQATELTQGRDRRAQQHYSRDEIMPPEQEATAASNHQRARYA